VQVYQKTLALLGGGLGLGLVGADGIAAVAACLDLIEALRR
jgi:hypothetical protein